MTPIRPSRRLKRSWIVAAALFLFALTVLFVAWRSQAAAESPNESIQFNHQKHLAADVPCLFCHPGVLNGAVATIPSVQKCIGCHSNVEGTSAEGKKDVELLLQLWEEGQPLRWEKVYDQPDFVSFNHRPHIAAGVNCENCHGNVQQMAMARQAYRINMGFCLYCHQKQSADKVTYLKSCSTCHK